MSQYVPSTSRVRCQTGIIMQVYDVTFRMDRELSCAQLNAMQYV